MTTEERLETLEKELAGLRAEVRTRRVIIEDESGTSRAELVVIGDGPVLVLFDENLTSRAELAVGKDGAELDLYDENGTPVWSAP